MLKKILYILSLFSILTLNPLLADNATQIELNVSKNKIAVGESFQILIKLKNASTDGFNIGNFNIPGIEKFNQTSSSQSTKVQIINGATTAVNEKKITLIALRQGEYEIGPVIINSNGLDVKSNIVKITVKKSEKKSFFDNTENNNILNTEKNNKSKNNFSNIFINIIALGLLIFFIYKLYKQKQNKSNNLRKLKKENYNNTTKSLVEKINILNKNNDNNFYLKAKEEILLFLKKKHSIETKELTSNEIIKILKEKNIFEIDDIKKALDLCDQGSFAKNNSIKNDLLNIIKKIN